MLADVLGQQIQRDAFTVVENRELFDHVAQLADVAGPGITFQIFHSLVSNTEFFFIVLCTVNL